MIKIKKDIIEKIIEHSRKDAPIEACGYLASDDHLVVRHYEMTNGDKSREHFSFLPNEQFKVLKESRSLGLKLTAIYHSHPESPARMSEEDIKLAHDPNISYIIVSLLDKVTVKSFKVKDKIVTEEEIEEVL